MTPFSSTNSYEREHDSIKLLIEYKELLDAGIITQEDFDIKKKELLTKPTQELPCSPEDLPNASNTKPSLDNGERLICKTCGKTLSTYQKVCPHCLSQSSIKAEEKKRGMKWYKCLIYFILPLSAVQCFLSGIIYFFDGGINVVFGVATIGLGILALVTRSTLNWYKKKGPKLLCAVFIVDTILLVSEFISYVLTMDDTLLYTFDSLLSEFIASPLPAGLSTLIALSVYVGFIAIARIIYILLNNSYFRKRSDVFIY